MTTSEEEQLIAELTKLVIENVPKIIAAIRDKSKVSTEEVRNGEQKFEDGIAADDAAADKAIGEMKK